MLDDHTDLGFATSFRLKEFVAVNYFFSCGQFTVRAVIDRVETDGVDLM